MSVRTMDGTRADRAVKLDDGHSLDLNSGRNSYANLVPCCDPCNRRKGPRSVEEFRALMTRPSFSPAHRQLLQSIGVDLDAVPAYRFWFEREGGER